MTMLSGRMMGSVPSSVPPDEMSVIRGLARLMDPEVGSEIKRIAAGLGRADVQHAHETLQQIFGLITSLTPIETAVQQQIEDLKTREAALAERERRLVARETAIAAALKAFDFGETDNGDH
jgi:hypothetical protein